MPRRFGRAEGRIKPKFPYFSGFIVVVRPLLTADAEHERMALVMNVAMLKAAETATTQTTALPFGVSPFGSAAGAETDGTASSAGTDTMFAALLQQMSEPANATAEMAVNTASTVDNPLNSTLSIKGSVARISCHCAGRGRP